MKEKNSAILFCQQYDRFDLFRWSSSRSLPTSGRIGSLPRTMLLHAIISIFLKCNREQLHSQRNITRVTARWNMPAAIKLRLRPGTWKMNEGMTDRNCCCQESIVVGRFPEYHPPVEYLLPDRRFSFACLRSSARSSHDLPFTALHGERSLFHSTSTMDRESSADRSRCRARKSCVQLKSDCRIR